MSNNLMSFFFVLSGFMAMHCNIETDFSDRANATGYIRRRFGKTYPIYILMYLCDLPGAIVSQIQPECGLFWLSLVSQPFLLHSWIGSQHISISNTVGWYLCTLYWLWMAFPFLNVKVVLSTHTWPKIFAIYISSVMVWILMVPFHTDYTKGVPLFRLGEFMMGCGVALTLKSKIHGSIALTGLILFFAYAMLDAQIPDLWSIEQLYGNCTLWTRKHDVLTVNPSVVLSKFSIVWAFVIHWLASSELSNHQTNNVIIRVLQFDFFRHLSSFSLELYLSHFTVAHAIKSLFDAMGIFDWWELDTMIIACYIIAYSLHLCMSQCGCYSRKSKPDHIHRAVEIAQVGV